MSDNWVKDINEMQEKFGVHDWVAKKITEGDVESLKTFLKFRIDFLKEELLETASAAGLKLVMNQGGQPEFVQSGTAFDPEEVVDGLIDLCVVSIGTLDAFQVNSYDAWDAVHCANMSKEPGVKASRPNPLGLPDLIKPDGWQAPSHADNHGALDKLK